MEQSTASEAIERDWRAVGGYLAQAMIEAAESTGDVELIKRVADIAKQDEILPDPTALILLEKARPGISEKVIARSAEIQYEVMKQEILEHGSFKARLRRIGRTIAG